MNLIFKDLSTKNEMKICLPLLQKMYQQIDDQNFEEIIDEMIKRNGYKMLAVFIDEKLVALCGYFVARMFYCGRYLQLCNLAVEENLRSQGIGKEILRYLENKARAMNCAKIVLDSYTENKKSHSLYFAEDFYIRGFHFMKDLQD